MYNLLRLSRLHQKIHQMKKSFYVIAFLTVFVFGIGAMFEFLTWPGRGMVMFAGFLLFNFGLVPAYFYHKYKTAGK